MSAKAAIPNTMDGIAPTPPTGGDTPQTGRSDNPGGKPKGKSIKRRGKGGNPAFNPSSNSEKTKMDPQTSTPKASGNGGLSPETSKVFQALGLSQSARNERVLSKVKTEGYFEIVTECWNQLVNAKPMIAEEFSFAEWRHVCALLLTWRIEQVQFTHLGIKPTANVRTPIPKGVRLFQPIWEVLASIGRVVDSELGVEYVPLLTLPESEDLSTDNDLDGLVDCTLYDWETSWNQVLEKRKDRDQTRKPSTWTGVSFHQGTEKSLLSENDRVAKMLRLKQARKELAELQAAPGSDSPNTSDRKAKKLQSEIDGLFVELRSDKDARLRPMPKSVPEIKTYVIGDDKITPDSGAYGKWLRWDDRLWMEYIMLSDILSQITLFSLSLPNETEGTYTWLLPVEESGGDYFPRLPKRSIPEGVWILATLTRMCALPPNYHSHWYVRGDVINTPRRTIVSWIRALIKSATPIENYGRI